MAWPTGNYKLIRRHKPSSLYSQFLLRPFPLSLCSISSGHRQPKPPPSINIVCPPLFLLHRAPPLPLLFPKKPHLCRSLHRRPPPPSFVPAPSPTTTVHPSAVRFTLCGQIQTRFVDRPCTSATHHCDRLPPATR